jgi:hypothetical protein
LSRFSSSRDSLSSIGNETSYQPPPFTFTLMNVVNNMTDAGTVGRLGGVFFFCF